MQHELQGLKDLVLFGGAPFAEDSGDMTIIHDDPRKAVHMAKMYYDYTREIIRSRVSIPFHTYYLSASGTRTFIASKKMQISKSSAPYHINRTLSGFVIDGGRLNVVLAPSGAGKSFFIKTHKEFTDGDTLLTWPEEEGWWLDEDRRLAVNSELWLQLAQSDRSKAILYNGDPTVIPRQVLHIFNFIALVLPLESVHKSNLALRVLEENGQPTDWGVVDKNRRDLHKFAFLTGVPIFSGFNEMRNHLYRTLHVKMEAAVRGGHTSINMTDTCAMLLSHSNTYTYNNAPWDSLTFGSHMSMRVHTNEYARFAGMTQHRWKHLTRNLPLYYVMLMIGAKPILKMTTCGNIASVTLNGNEITASGHMLGALTWLAFPDCMESGMPRQYPDFHTYLVMYMRNQHVHTPSLEPYAVGIAYHRWIETFAGIIGSYYAIKILLKRGLHASKRNIYLWRLYARRAVRMIAITPRTWCFNVKHNRDSDPRFGTIDRAV